MDDFLTWDWCGWDRSTAQYSSVTVTSISNVYTKATTSALFNAHACKAGSTTAKCSLPAVSIHLVLINNKSIHWSGDSNLVNLIHTAVSTLFNLPCIHTPLRFYSRDYNSKHFAGCGWLLRARKGNNAAHIELQKLPSHHRELVRVVERVAMFLLNHLYNVISKQLTIYQWQWQKQDKTNIAVESINTCATCSVI